MNFASDFPASATHRLPVWTLGLSLAIHLALLATPLWQRPALTDLPPLAVSIRMPAVLAAAERMPELARAELPVVQPAPPVPPPASPRSNTPRSPTVPSRPALLAVAGPAAGASVVTAPAASPAITVASATAVDSGDVAATARALDAKRVAEAADAAAMARYVRLLGDLLAQQQQYPRLAALRGWEGEVRLRLQVARKGTIIAVHLVHSSGFDVLDQHAVQLVQGTTLPPPPAAHSSNAASPDFLIDIPIHYALKRNT